jgi:hypothetical protein
MAEAAGPGFYMLISLFCQNGHLPPLNADDACIMMFFSSECFIQEHFRKYNLKTKATEGSYPASVFITLSLLCTLLIQT